VPARDRRTIGELLAGSDALARETLLDATPENARAMVRSWNQLVAPAVHLWAALASRPEAGRRLLTDHRQLRAQLAENCLEVLAAEDRSAAAEAEARHRWIAADQESYL
jgi:hypothetical protein